MTTIATQDTAALRAQLEQELLALWKAVLEVPEIDPQDDFYALGGHSLLALEMRDILRKQLELPKLDLDPLRTPTVAAMAASILAQLGVEETV